MLKAPKSAEVTHRVSISNRKDLSPCLLDATLAVILDIIARLAAFPSCAFTIHSLKTRLPFIAYLLWVKAIPDDLDLASRIPAGGYKQSLPVEDVGSSYVREAC